MITTIAGIFSGILANTWQAAVIIPLVLVIRGLVGNRLSPRWRHLLWLLIFLRLLLPIAWLPASSLSLQNVTVVERPLEQVELAVGSSSSPALRSSPELQISSSDSFGPIGGSKKTRPLTLTEHEVVALIWLTGTLLVAIFILVAQVILARRIAAGAAMIPRSVSAAYDDLCRRLKIVSRPRLMLSSAVASPLLIGFFRPCIVLPAANLETYSGAELAHIFAHEIAHARRGDAWAQLLQLVALCLHWFNPLAWLACRAAQLDRELAADEWALAHLREVAPEDYGQTLLRLIAAQSAPRFVPATLGIVENFQQLKRRLHEIAGFSKRGWLDSTLGLGLIGIVALAVLTTRVIASSIGALKDAIYDRAGIVLVENRTGAQPHYVYDALAATTLGLDRSEAPGARHGLQGMLHGSSATGVQLTLDARVQYIAEKAVRDSKFTRGAVVVMDPNNGDVLALVSVPSFNPNKITSPEKLQALSEEWSAPLENRTLEALTPGSTYKLLVALAGLRSGKATPETQFDCPASIPIGDHLFHNSDGAPGGRMGLHHALVVSSDVYFYQFGLQTGIEAIDEMATRAGFGQQWNVLNGADESAGIVPGPAWMKKEANRLEHMHNPTNWSAAQTANTAIGQGFVLASPLQMSAFVSAIANGGTVYQPRLYSAIEMKNGESIHPPEGKIFGTLGVKPQDLQAIQNAMLDVVESEPGTGWLARISGLPIAGKTGTAQTAILHNRVVRRELTTWFTCYAPFEKPRYVITVVVQGGNFGGTTCAPIAKQILTQLSSMDRGQRVEPQPLAPVTATFPPAPLAQ